MPARRSALASGPENGLPARDTERLDNQRKDESPYLDFGIGTLFKTLTNRCFLTTHENYIILWNPS
jgi:hypothetical protein